MKGWTQEQLAEASSLHYSYIGGVEPGERNISLETLEKIVTAFQVPSAELFRDELLQDEDERERQQVIDEHMTLINSRSTADIRMITKINNDILNAIDSK